MTITHLTIGSHQATGGLEHLRVGGVPRVIQEFFPVSTGPANQALALARGLAEYGIGSPVFTTTPDDDERVQGAGVTALRFAPSLALPQFRLAPRLLTQLNRQPAALIHTHSWRNPACDGAIAIARRRGIPLIAQAHGVAFGYRFSQEPTTIRVARQAYEFGARRQVLAIARFVVAATDLEATELRDYGFDPKRIVVIPIGVHESFFAATERGERSGPPMLLTVGRLAPRRNIEQIIQALALLNRQGVLARLRVVGPEVRLSMGETVGYRQRLERLAQELGVADRIEFVGARHGAALAEEYRAADIFICTTQYENFGQPIAEAAAAKLPIVSTPTGIAPALLRAGAGLPVAHDDVEATAMALRLLCERQELRSLLGAAAGNYAQQYFDWRQIVPRYIALYEQALMSDVSP